MVLLRDRYDELPGSPMDQFPDTGQPPIPPAGDLPASAPPDGDQPTTWGPPGGGGGGDGGGGGGGGRGRPQYNFRGAPVFIGPQFRRPTFADAQNEPGYQFRLDTGRNALEGSAAARGVLRTGGTLKDITEYGQSFGAQEYGNVYNRALQGFDRDYRGAYDAFAPRLAEWQLLSGAEQAAGLAQFAAAQQRRGGGGGGEPPPPMAPPPQNEQPGGQIPWQGGNPGYDPYEWRKPNYGQTY